MKSAKQQQLEDTKKELERIKIMLDTTPLVCTLWNREHRIIDCNQEALRVFEVNREEFQKNFFDFAPPFQPDGQSTRNKGRSLIETAFEQGKNTAEWMAQKLDGTLLPLEITFIRITYGNEDVVIAYGRDLQSLHQMIENISQRDHLLSIVNQVAALLLSADDTADMESAISTSLEIIGRSVGAERVNIWRNEIIAGDSYHLCLYSWCSEEQRQNT